MTSRLLAIACLLLLFTQGCGNKGPLYLPDDNAPASDDATLDDDKRG